MARRRNSCEDCTTSVSHCCGTCLQYTLHTPHPPHHSPAQHSIAQLTTPHRQQASIPLSMSTMRRCAKCKSSLGLGQHERERRKHCDTHTQTFAHTHTSTHSLRSCSAWAATFTWRILKRVTAIKAPESAYAHHAHSPPAQKQNKTNSAIKNDKVAVAAQSQRSVHLSLKTVQMRSLSLPLSSPPRALHLSLYLSLSRCGHSVINIYHISTL